MVTQRAVNSCIAGSTPALPANMKIAIVGAGLSGATLAYQLGTYFREADITLFEQRGHLAGNAHTERDPETGVMVHKYGPHIFHTDNAGVWGFVKMFADFVPHIQRTKGIAGGKLYSLPINLHTINQFFGMNLSPQGAERFIAGQRSTPYFPSPPNFADAAIGLIGMDLYQAFMGDYTRKQWGRDPSELPASILKRLPMRYDYNDNAFFHRYQGIPRHGYTDMVQRMLDMSRLTVRLGEKLNRNDIDAFDHVFYSGAIDEWFDYAHGMLPYRTLDFEVIRSKGDFQGCSVLNNCDADTPWTRSTEHKHFTPWEDHEFTIVSREHPREAVPGDLLYYPIRLAREQAQLLKYVELAQKETRVTFFGRLGTYSYLDIDTTIAQAIGLAKDFRKQHTHGI